MKHYQGQHLKEQSPEECASPSIYYPMYVMGSFLV